MERTALLLDLIRSDLLSRARGCPDVSLVELLEGRGGFEILSNSLGAYGHVTLVDIFECCQEAESARASSLSAVHDLELEICSLESEIKGLCVEKEEVENEIRELRLSSEKLASVREAFETIAQCAEDLAGVDNV